MTKKENSKIICSENLSLDYFPQFFSKNTADSYFQTLSNRIVWQEEIISIMGRQVKVPRLMAWYGDEDTIYSYSGVKHEPKKWIEPLLEINAYLQNCLGIRFNSVLANLYRNGQDSMGWHADKEPELGKQPIIASVSFGAERQFSLRHKKQKAVLKLLLSHGSVLLMSGETQRYWKHALPKSKLINEPRINLTFRQIVDSR
jgi:alkylated DNA repair dioxygenase AlkB